MVVYISYNIAGRNDLAGLGQLLVEFKPDYVFMQEVTVSKERLEANPDFVCVSLDMKNAHNEMSRRSCVLALEAQPELRHMAQHVAICLAAHHRLEAGGETWGVASVLQPKPK